MVCEEASQCCRSCVPLPSFLNILKAPTNILLTKSPRLLTSYQKIRRYWILAISNAISFGNKMPEPYRVCLRHVTRPYQSMASSTWLDRLRFDRPSWRLLPQLLFPGWRAGLCLLPTSPFARHVRASQHDGPQHHDLVGYQAVLLPYFLHHTYTGRLINASDHLVPREAWQGRYV